MQAVNDAGSEVWDLARGAGESWKTSEEERNEWNEQICLC